MGAGRSLTRLHTIYVKWGPQTPQSDRKPTRTDADRPDLDTLGSPLGRSVESDETDKNGVTYQSASCLPTVDEMYPRPAPIHRPMKAIEEQLYTYAIQAQPSTRSLSTLKEWSGKYEWTRRAAPFDAKHTIAQVAEHRQVMQDGLALSFKRVQTLRQLAEILLAEVLAQDEKGNYVNLWLRDVKTVGGGEFCKDVTVRRYNSSLVGDLRGLLDDIAKESGGRQSNLESLIRIMPWERLPEKYARRMISGETPREVLVDMFEDIAEVGREDNILKAAK